MNLWNNDGELLLASWAEKAICLRWIHDRSSKFFYKLNMIISIPTILLSTISGTATFSLGKHWCDFEYYSIIIGSSSLITSCLIGLQTYLKYNEISEKHRMSSLLYMTYYREISNELILPRHHRDNYLEYLKVKRIEFDRILKDSPCIPQKIIKQFKIKFKNYSLNKPDIANGMNNIKIYKNDNQMTEEDIIIKLRTFYKLVNYKNNNKINSNTLYNDI